MKLLREVLKNTYAPHLILVDESAMNDLSKNKSKKEMSKHIDHTEDLLIRDGADGFDTIEGALRKTNDFLRGKNPDKFSISSKYDGSPSLVWGCDPKTGQFFVSTKSYFNKNPKINYSDEDIKANHGSSIGLSKKLRASLKHLPEVTPKVGIFQGDLLWIPGDIQDDGKKVSFQPNTLTYHVPSNSEEGEKIKKSKIGIAPHTEYKDVGGGEMRAHFNNPIHKLKKSENVHMVDPKVTGPFYYSPDEQKKFEEHLKQARKYHQELVKYNGYPLLQDHEALLLAYINDSVKGKKNLDASSYAAFVQTRYQKKIESLKLPKTQSKMKDTINQELNKIVGSKNVLDNLFKCHKQIQLAKHILINSLSKSVPYGHSIQGKPSKPEGFVVVYNGRPIKLVDRQHFSAANFDWNQKVNPEDNPHVISWSKMNPGHIGHEKVLKKGEEVANRIGAKHQAYTTRTKDGNKNPLDPDDKMKWLKTMFPGKNIIMASKDTPTIMAQLQHLNNSGVKDLTLIVGSDRLDHFQDILNRYNGPSKNKLFNFKRARVISAGSRDDKSEQSDGASSTKMRKAAKNDDFKSFKKYVPKSLTSDQTIQYFHDVKNSMKIVKYDEKKKKTPPSLHHVVAGYLSHS